MHGRYATRSELWTGAAVIESDALSNTGRAWRSACPTADPVAAIGQPHADSGLQLDMSTRVVHQLRMLNLHGHCLSQRA
jgi:hypothetical protein